MRGCLSSVSSDSCLLRSDARGGEIFTLFFSSSILLWSKGARPCLFQHQRVVSEAFDDVKSRKAELYYSKCRIQNRGTEYISLANVHSESCQMKRELMSILCQPAPDLKLHCVCLPSPGTSIRSLMNCHQELVIFSTGLSLYPHR